MSAADAIVGALQRFGRTMTLRRLTKGPGSLQIPLDVEVKATDDPKVGVLVVGSVLENVAVITLSDFEIAQAQWPGPPRKNDRLVMDGREMNVDNAISRRLGSDILVHALIVRG